MHWEFLIQKDGEQTWHSLQSSLEIEEGKYRLVAHSNRPHLEVEVRIIYEPTDLNYPNHRQVYCRRTNSQGLLMLFPYTYLQAGTWEIRCYGDIMAELLGKKWQETVQIYSKVRNTSNTPYQNFFPTESQVNETEIIPDLQHKEPIVNDDLAQLEHLLRYKIEPMLQFFPPAPIPQMSIDSQLAGQVELQLDDDTFMRIQGESILVSGRLEIVGRIETTSFEGQLRYELRESRKGETIFTFKHSLLETILPIDFQHTLLVPDEPAISFLVGEVILESATGEILARQAFSVTTDLNYTQEIIAHPINYTIELADLQTNSSYIFDLSIMEDVMRTELNLPEPEKMQKILQLSSTAIDPILPPKLSPAHSCTPVKKSPQLPPIRS